MEYPDYCYCSSNGECRHCLALLETLEKEKEMKTTYQEVLTLLLSVAPNATVSVDDDGQVIIHTNLTDIGGSGYLEEMQ